MERKLPPFEEVLRQSLEKSELSPSSKVLRKLRFRLWVSDFFGFNLRKVNILYTTILLGGITSVVLINKNRDADLTRVDVSEDIPVLMDESAMKVIPVEKVEEPEKPSEEAAMLTANFEIETLRGCAPLEVNFTNKSVKADAYSWDFGTGEKSSDKHPVYIYKEPGTYSAVLTATGKEGQKASYKKQIEVLQGPVADLEIDLNKSDISSREIHFSNKSDGAATYTWEFGDDQQSEIREPSHTYEDYGVYQVQLIAKAKNGCSDTAYQVNRFIEKDYSLAFPLNFRPNPFSRSDNGYWEAAGSDASIFYPKNNGVNEYQLTIRTPNGLVVFTTRDIRQGWNGYIGGRLAPRGIYTYIAKGVYPNGQAFTQEGKFELIVEDYY